MTIRHVTRRAEGAGNKLYMCNFFSPSDLCEDLHTRHMNCCEDVRQSHKGMPGVFEMG